MSQPLDCCRVFFHLRNRAWAGPYADCEVPAEGAGIVDLDHDPDGPETLGLSLAEARDAVRCLQEADLIRPVTPRQGRDWGLADEGHRLMLVEPFDDLTAATILMGE